MSKAALEPIEWRKFLPGPVIGVDEVGRGCLAGPVYAAAVILDPELDTQFRDSKLLSADRRDKLSKQILSEAQVSLGFASVDEIAELNILGATWLAMRRAIAGLKVSSGHVLVDGHMTIPQLPGFHQTAVVKGDLRVQPIAAASIVAKVTRDQLMAELDKVYPGYGFADHKGYGTVTHREAIARLGPCREHRSSFAGVREHLPLRAEAPAAQVSR
jgi:ribonuclease HII